MKKHIILLYLLLVSFMIFSTVNISYAEDVPNNAEQGVELANNDDITESENDVNEKTTHNSRLTDQENDNYKPIENGKEIGVSNESDSSTKIKLDSQVVDSTENIQVVEEESTVKTKETSEQMNEFSNVSRATSVKPSISYTTHVQNKGWLDTVSNGEVGGIPGQSNRLEAIQISLQNAPYSGGVTYNTHVQDYGWLEYVSDGDTSGTTGESKQVEAIQISLTGQMAEHYDIYYRVYSQLFGWLGWSQNGEPAGTTGLFKKIEAIEIILVEKGGNAPGSTDKSYLTKPSVSYSSHVQSYGWQGFVEDGTLSGTQGQAKQIEAIKILLNDSQFSGGITYSTHVKNKGWLSTVSDGEVSGTVGENKRVEAIQINVTGDIANYFDVYYRVHIQDLGWLGWTKNGEKAGSEGLSKQVESLEVRLVEKGKNPPGSTDKSFITPPSVSYSTHVETYGWLEFVKNGDLSGTEGKAKRLEAIKIELKDSAFAGNIKYSAHVQDYGWLEDVFNGDISGTTGQSKRVEAIKISLTGEVAKYYDVYYRVHIEQFGWLGWAKNGMRAGSEQQSKRLEAIEIKLVPKGKGESVSEKKAFKKPLTVFLDPGHGGSDPGAIFGIYHEADLNLSVAKKVQSMLKSRNIKVYMSRTNDKYVSLLDRSKMANSTDAEIFVSIHHNNSGSTSANGIESYFYEFDSMYPPKINSDMHNNEVRIERSVVLTDLIQDRMIAHTSANNRGTDGAAFSVIRETKAPATLLELGFISNSIERNKLISDSYQTKLATAIVEGIVKYFEIYN